MKCLTLAVAALLILSTEASAALIGNYDPALGSLTFSYDGAEGTLAGIRLNSSVGGLIAGQATNLEGSISGPLSVINDQAPNFIEWGNLLGINFEEVSAGRVMQPGIDAFRLDQQFELIYRSLSRPTVDIRAQLYGYFIESFFPDLPDGSTIDLTAALSTGGLAPGAVTFSGVGHLTSVEIVDQLIPSYFGASIREFSSVDLTIDLAIARTLPAGTVPQATLLIQDDIGLQYRYHLVVFPEPSTVVLVGLGALSLISMRR